jgi:predicted ATPase/class 3 adenylate cyclase
LTNIQSIEYNLYEGTVTFLFTDIEGSTRLLHQLGDCYSQVLADQRCIIRDEIGAWHGREVDTQGDSFFISFATPLDAVNAAVEIQRRIQSHNWPEGATVRLRMGLHSGEPLLAEEGYVGLDVHLAARVGNLGYGGQVLLSDITAKSVRDGLPEPLQLIELGKHSLKDFDQPEPISQLVIPGLPSDFPALKSLEACPNNLPTQLTAFIGRRSELDELEALIVDPGIRLVTILGAGGMGKTRLALAFAERQVDLTCEASIDGDTRFPDGVYFVALAPLESRENLITAIAKAIKFQFYQGVEPKQQILDFFCEKQLLLILDNFEHLLDGVPLVNEILQAAPEVKVLATSRARLNLSSELIYPLRGMAYPEQDLGGEISLKQIENQYSALNLFLHRVVRKQPEFERSRENLRCAERVCRLVEGMPLGLELAAGWGGTLSLGEIVEEIQSSLDFLETRDVDLPDRHRSLRAVFESTWKLLSERERETFAALSVFQGGFSKEAAEYVTDASVKELAGLADQSLIQRKPNRRYEVHEQLRQFAFEHLQKDEDRLAQVRDRHSEYYAEFLDQRWVALATGGRGDEILEMDNIRSGLRWAVERSLFATIRKQLKGIGLILISHGWTKEGVDTFRWLIQQLGSDNPSGERGIAYGLALSILGEILYWNVKKDEAVEVLRKSTEILRSVDDPVELAFAVKILAHLDQSIEYDEVVRIFKESLDFYRSSEDDYEIAETLLIWAERAIGAGHLEQAERMLQEAIKYHPDFVAWYSSLVGAIASRKGEFDVAKRYYQEAYDAWARKGLNQWAAARLMWLGDLALHMGQIEEAAGYHQLALKERERIGNPIYIAESHADLGFVFIKKRDYQTAEGHFARAMELYKQSGIQGGEGYVLEGLGELALETGEYEQAKRQFKSCLLLDPDVQDPWHTLRVIERVARLYSTMNRSTQAVELASMLVEHEATRPLTRDRAGKLLEALSRELPADSFQIAVESGKSLELWCTVDEVLEELK